MPRTSPAAAPARAAPAAAPFDPYPAIKPRPVPSHGFSPLADYSLSHRRGVATCARSGRPVVLADPPLAVTGAGLCAKGEVVSTGAAGLLLLWFPCGAKCWARAVREGAGAA